MMRKVVEIETYFLPALADALDQLAGYLTEKGDIVGASAMTIESTAVRRRFTSLPPQPDFLFEKIELEGDDKDGTDMKEEWETALEADISVNAEVLPAAVDAFTSTSAAPSSQVAQKTDEKPDSAGDTTTIQRATSSVADILYTPLEIRLRSTPMDILWWMLVGIMGVSLGVLSLACMVLWSRIQ
jgi:hypothetical protein